MARMVRKTLRCFTNKSQWKIKIVLVLEHTIFKMLCFCYSDVNSEKKGTSFPYTVDAARNATGANQGCVFFQRQRIVDDEVE